VISILRHLLKGEILKEKDPSQSVWGPYQGSKRKLRRLQQGLAVKENGKIVLNELKSTHVTSVQA
jgi:hypothetical protein